MKNYLVQKYYKVQMYIAYQQNVVFHQTFDVMFSSGGVNICNQKGEPIHAVLFFPYLGFVPLGFPRKVFNEAALDSVSMDDVLFSLARFLSHWVFPS